MSDLRAATQQALEAWEHINLYGFVLADYEGPMEQAITALKAALEQPEQEQPVANNPDPYHLSRILHELAGSASMCWEHVDRAGVFQSTQAADVVAAAIAEIRQRMKDAPPRREWRNQCGETCERAKLCAVCAKGLEQPEQAVPVAWIQPDHLHKARQAPFLCRVEPTKRMSDFVAIYTHPPRREWQGLTDEEIKNAVGASAEFWATSALWIKSVARAVEAAHGIKENT
jgi:hypothetical protein